MSLFRIVGYVVLVKFYTNKIREESLNFFLYFRPYGHDSSTLAVMSQKVSSSERQRGYKSHRIKSKVYLNTSEVKPRYILVKITGIEQNEFLYVERTLPTLTKRTENV